MKGFEPGEMVADLAGHAGIVLSPAELDGAKTRLKEGRRPGRYFAPGCCPIPDYVIQVPVLFEDGTYDVMRAMNLKRISDPSEDRRQDLLRRLGHEAPKGERTVQPCGT